MTLIAAFDLASATGCADGRVGDQKPRLWSWYLTDAGGERPARLALLRRFCDKYFEEFKPDKVAYELPMSIAVISGMMAKGKFLTSENVLATLRGAIGVLECCAAHAGITHIEGINVNDARKHFCGRRTFPKGTGKEEVAKVCRSLGYNAESDNESDAAAIWSLMCAKDNPRIAAALIGGRQLSDIADGPLFAGLDDGRRRRR